MTPEEIEALQMVGAGIYMLCAWCILPALIIVGLFQIPRFLGWTQKDVTAADFPDNFHARCPMCGSKRLEWGVSYTRRLFVSKDRPRWGFGRSSRLPSASCRNCGYVMMFDRRK